MQIVMEAGGGEAPIRTGADPPHASRIVAAIVARRGPSERLRLGTAHATKAGLRIGIANMGNNIPIAPLRNRLVYDARCRGQSDYRQDDGAQALGPRRPAKEQPPWDDGQPADGSR